MADEHEPLDDAPDPTEDTPDAESEDTPEADDSSQTDWTPKDRAEASRKITEQALENKRLRDEIAAARQAQPDEDEADDDADDGTGYLDSQNALLAEQVFGPEVKQAAEAVWDNLVAASTTADWFAALESYHEARLQGAAAPAKPAASGGQSRQQAVQPRVDTNRSDSPASDDQIAEAAKSGSLSAFTGAVAAKFGYGPDKAR